MRVAVVGVGVMGQLHVRLLRERGDLEVVCADVDEARAEALAAETGARAVAADAVLREADAVVVATPPEWHAPVVEAAVDAGRAVLCEKPLAFDLPETLALAARVERAGGRVQVGFQRRWDRGFAAARRLVEDGTLGPLVLLRLAAHDPRTPAGPRRAGGRRADAAPLFRDSSIHDFDLARWLTGDEVVEVHAEGLDRDRRRPADPLAIETAVVTLRTAGGTLAVLDATILDPHGYDIRAELIGERDSAAVGLTPRTPMRGIDPDATPPGTPWPGYLERFHDAYREELDAFVAAVRDEAPVPVTVRDGVEAMRLAVAATRSVAEGRRIRLDEVDALPGARREVA